MNEERLMFNYRGNKSYWKSMNKERFNKMVSRDKKKMLFVFREEVLLDCWRFEKSYEIVDGISLYREWAAGEGLVARHLCSDSKCVNPLHLLRGSELDNAKDEIEVRNYGNRVLEEITGDYSLKGEEEDLIHLTLLPKAQHILEKSIGIKTLREANEYIRGLYRKAFVQDLINKIDEIDSTRLKLNVERLEYLKGRNDIVVITIPNKRRLNYVE